MNSNSSSAQAVVVLPGIMGSVLTLNGQTVWPRPISELVFGFSHLELLLSDDLQATDILRSVSVSTQYASLLDLLTRCGFRESVNLFPFAYDWRRSNVLTAHKLADLLDQIAASPANPEIHLVAHSMGGLISRYYLESGCFSSRPGLQRVRSLFALGVPHRGAPSALPAILGLDRKVFLSGPQVRQVGADPRFPSMYQLLPPPGEPFVMQSGSTGRALPIDIYDPEMARALGLSLEHLESARQFHAKLDPARRPGGVRYFCFSGSRMRTVTGIELSPSDPRSIVKMQPDHSGDGTVPVWSSLLTGIQSAFAPGEHSGIYKSNDVRRPLATLLGYSGTLDARQAVDVSIRDQVVDPCEPVSISLGIAAGSSSLNGIVQIHREDLNGSGSSVPVGAPVQLRLDAATHMTLSLDAPEMPGAYRISFSDHKGVCLGSDHFFVQLPSSD